MKYNIRAHTRIFANLIKTHLTRFLTMIAITTLSIAFLTGMLSTRDNLLNTVNSFYTKTNVSDFNIKSRSFFNDSDQDYFDSISNSTLKYSLEIPFYDDKTLSMLIVSNNNDVNKWELVDGRLPANSNEVVASENYNLNSITYDMTYNVVGHIKSPLYFEKADTNYYFYRIDESLTTFNNVYITINNINKLDRFSSFYMEEIKTYKKTLNQDYIILSLFENASFMSYKSYVEIIQKISNIIPFFFIAVSALVLLSSMTRTIDTDRNRIGILRFLGYTKNYIYSLYLLFGILAVLIGSFLGMVSGFRLIPELIYNTFSNTFNLPPLSFGFYYFTSLACVLGVLSIVLLITWGELSKKLRETITELLKARVPKNGKTIFLEKITFIWKRLSFKFKNTFRNLFLYKNRLIMTIIGIMGCSALIFTGLGLNDSISDISNKQYKKIILYQAEVTTNVILPIPNEILYFYERNIVIDNILNSEKINFVVVEEPENLNKFINLLDTKEKPYKYEKGLLVTENLANYYKIKEGDTIILDSVEYKVNKVVKSFVEPLIIIDKITYNKEYTNNKAYINNIDENELKGLEGITNYNLTSSTDKDFQSLSKQINIIVIIVLISAITLAVVVTFNLTNINIEERTMEIGTLKILGYKNGEVLGYIYREILIMTVIGALFGYLLGLLFERYILSLVDSFNLMLSRHISIQTLLLSFFITLFVSIIVDLFMILKLNKIKMISSLVE